MKRAKLLFTALIISGLLTSPAAAENLMEVFELATNSDPLLKEAAANRMATLESKPQARAGLLPTISLDGSYDDDSSGGLRTDTTAGTVNQFPGESDSNTLFYRLQLSQPLFRWDRWIALKRADKTIAQAEANYGAAQQDLAVRVTQGYFNTLAARDSLEAETLNKEAIKRQLEQNETRFEVGLIAITDVLESRAAYDQSVASEIAAKRQLALAKENLREIIGERIDDLTAPGDDLELVAPKPANEDAWVAKAQQQNLTLEASRIAVEIANDDVRSQRTGHYPSVDLVVGRSERDVDGTSVNNGVRFANESDNTSDNIAIQFSVPIYSGGAVSSRVRQAIYQKTAAQQRLERISRETERQTRDAYLSVLAEISRVRALKEAVKSSETALSATEAGFDVGTRTSVDVLNSRRDLLRAQVNFYQSRYDYLVNLINLKRAAGTLSGEDLREISNWLESSNVK